MKLSKVKLVSRLYTEKNFKYLIIILIGIISFAHLYKLGIVPTGLFIDETSIGYNAATISQSGTDEYGNHFPVILNHLENIKTLFIFMLQRLFSNFLESLISL
jgi:hypothetical protein